MQINTQQYTGGSIRRVRLAFLTVAYAVIFRVYTRVKTLFNEYSLFKSSKLHLTSTSYIQDGVGQLRGCRVKAGSELMLREGHAREWVKADQGARANT